VIPEDADMIKLGGDIIGGPITKGGYVLTRLHARYGKADMKDDLRFAEAKPITGGREVYSKNGIEYGSKPADQNFFQARYAIRYWWTGEIKCKNPQRAVWGPNPNGSPSLVIAASKVAFAPRGKLELASVIQARPLGDRLQEGRATAACPSQQVAGRKDHVVRRRTRGPAAATRDGNHEAPTIQRRSLVIASMPPER